MVSFHILCLENFNQDEAERRERTEQNEGGKLLKLGKLRGRERDSSWSGFVCGTSRD